MALTIKIYCGCGCKCTTIEERVQEAADALKIEVIFEKHSSLQEDFDQFDFKTPAILIQDTLVVSGKTPSERQIRKILRSYNK
jgi:hypothetical protein